MDYKPKLNNIKPVQRSKSTFGKSDSQALVDLHFPLHENLQKNTFKSGLLSAERGLLTLDKLGASQKGSPAALLSPIRLYSSTYAKHQVGGNASSRKQLSIKMDIQKAAPNKDRCGKCSSTNIVHVPTCRFCGHIPMLNHNNSNIKRFGYRMIELNPSMTATELLDIVVDKLHHTCDDSSASKIYKANSGPQTPAIVIGEFPKEKEEDEEDRRQSPGRQNAASPLSDSTPAVSPARLLLDDSEKDALMPQPMNQPVHITDHSSKPEEPQSIVFDDEYTTADAIHYIRSLHQSQVSQDPVADEKLKQVFAKSLASLLFCPREERTQENEWDLEDLALESLKCMDVSSNEAVFEQYTLWCQNEHGRDVSPTKDRKNTLEDPYAGLIVEAPSLREKRQRRRRPSIQRQRSMILRNLQILPTLHLNEEDDEDDSDDYDVALEDDSDINEGLNSSIRFVFHNMTFIVNEQLLVKSVFQDSKARQDFMALRAIDREFWYVSDQAKRESFLKLNRDAQKSKVELYRKSRTLLQRQLCIAALATKCDFLTTRELHTLKKLVAQKETIEWTNQMKIWSIQYERNRRALLSTGIVPINVANRCFIPEEHDTHYVVPVDWSAMISHRKPKKRMMKTQIQLLIYSMYTKFASSDLKATPQQYMVYFLNTRVGEASTPMYLCSLVETVTQYHHRDVWIRDFCLFSGMLGQDEVYAECFQWCMSIFRALPFLSVSAATLQNVQQHAAALSSESNSNKSKRKQSESLQASMQLHPLKFSKSLVAVECLCREYRLDLDHWRAQLSVHAKFVDKLKIIDVGHFLHLLKNIWTHLRASMDFQLRQMYLEFDEDNSNDLTSEQFKRMLTNASISNMNSPPEQVQDVDWNELYRLCCDQNSVDLLCSMQSFTTAAISHPKIQNCLGLNSIRENHVIMENLASRAILDFMYHAKHMAKTLRVVAYDLSNHETVSF